MKQFTMHFDGGARPKNPGNGYGSYEIQSVKPILLKTNACYCRRAERLEFGFMSNNQAEYHAMISGLKALRHDASHGWLSEFVLIGGINLTCFSDSKLLVEQMCGRWKAKVLHIQELRDEARALLKGFAHWNIRWNSRTVNVEKFGH